MPRSALFFFSITVITLTQLSLSSAIAKPIITRNRYGQEHISTMSYLGNERTDHSSPYDSQPFRKPLSTQEQFNRNNRLAGQIVGANGQIIQKAPGPRQLGKAELEAISRPGGFYPQSTNGLSGFIPTGSSLRRRGRR